VDSNAKERSGADIAPCLAKKRRAQIPAEVGEEATTEVMTPINPLWDGFAAGLAAAIRAEGCDAETLRLSERLLRGMDGINVEASLAFFRSRHGCCDCEVLSNVGW
jgi:hypothetical protein